MSPSSPIVPSTGLTGKSSPGAMARAPGLSRRGKDSVNVRYSSMGRAMVRAADNGADRAPQPRHLPPECTGGSAGVPGAATARPRLGEGLVANQPPAVLLVQVGDRRAWPERVQRLPRVGLARREHLRGIDVHLCGGEALLRGGGHLLALGAFPRQIFSTVLDGPQHGLRPIGIDRARIYLF